MAVAHNAIVSDDTRFRLTPDHYLKSRAEMAKLFADLPEALESTNRDSPPLLVHPQDAQADPAALHGRHRPIPRKRNARRRSNCAGRPEEGWIIASPRSACRLAYEEKEYRERLEFELSVIERMKFPGYFLIVADFIKWAKQHDIPVGPGRGSGAGSLVAYALTITDVDPLRFSLLFERFLNPERVSMPDFDIDFCQDRREEVIRYVQRQIRPRAGRADHHLRFAAGSRRIARCRPCAGNAVRTGR